MEKQTCAKCKFAVFQDTGYSNWTVEGTDFYCAKKLHPADGFDSFYTEDDRLNHGKDCAGFEAGEPVRMDVDQDNVSELTSEEKVVWEMYQSTPEAGE